MKTLTIQQRNYLLKQMKLNQGPYTTIPIQIVEVLKTGKYTSKFESYINLRSWKD